MRWRRWSRASRRRARARPVDACCARCLDAARTRPARTARARAETARTARPRNPARRATAMSLGQRLKQSDKSAGTVAPAEGGTAEIDGYHELKSTLHARVVDHLELSTIHQLPRPELR